MRPLCTCGQIDLRLDVISRYLQCRGYRLYTPDYPEVDVAPLQVSFLSLDNSVLECFIVNINVFPILCPTLHPEASELGKYVR